MRCWSAVALLLGAACGRVQFDPLAGDADVAGGADMAIIDTTGCVDVPGLAAHYPMGASDVVGSVLRDRSGSGRDAALSGNFTISAGKLDESLDFDPGGTAYVTLPDLPIVAAPGAGTTVTLWFFRANVATVDEDLVNAPQSPARYSLWLVQDQLCVNTQTGECWGVTNTGLGGRWVHAAVVFRNGLETTSEIYMDGARQSLGCTMAACDVTRTVTNPLQLGASDVYAFHGRMDDVRVYTRSLTAAEIAAIAAGQVCGR